MNGITNAKNTENTGLKNLNKITKRIMNAKVPMMNYFYQI